MELSLAFNRMAAQLSTLEQSRRDFVANVSHELRSPITSIQGFAQGMLDGTIPQEEHEKYLQVVEDETQRLSKLIAALLNLSRMENEEISLAFTDFDVNEMARRVLISRINALEEKALDVEVNFEEDACFVRADSDQIQQVMINLLDNAIKFTPRGGLITLSSGRAGEQVYMRVKDNGIGIMPEDAPHIFDRFYKADKAHTVGKGTGLGLAICFRIMERHGQSIRLLNGEGGAEFEITLAPGKNPGGQNANLGTGEN
ncbi:MAG: sensor histidine kinase, partial [Selenomonadaceae bacterium]|nr:sensor histidine kinase [Selenomonadaceae bacterium]